MMLAPHRLAALTPLSFLGLAALLLAACATRPAANAPSAAAATPTVVPLDASYDWHRQMIMPFGTVFKESPVALHEVLLFRDESHAGSELGRDCYTVDGSPPRFVDHEPEEFRLCFSHDRLDRIETSVRLASDEGPGVLARACSSWLKNSTAAAPTADRCEGRDGDVAFSARFGRAGDEAGPAASSAPEPDAQTPSLVLILSPAAP
jgi:hypothetical protein